MATRFDGQINPNTAIKQERGSPSNDVWTSISSVIGDWSLGEADLWARLVSRHEEILHTGGVGANLFQQFNVGVLCTCVKPETGQVNQRCPTCWGSKFEGGYEKFGFQTFNISAGNPGLTLVDTKRFRRFPDNIELVDGKTTGFVLSPKFRVTNNFGFDSFLISGFDDIRKLTQNGFKLEFSTDSGNTFMDISTAPSLTDPVFEIQFKLTLTRNSVTDPSPFFQIFRVRFKSRENSRILISKRSFPEQRWLESFGVRVKLDGVTWWTTPSLGLVDGTVVFVQENDIFEIIEGEYKRQTIAVEEFPDSGRFKPSDVTYVEPQGRFLSQRFNMRLLQADEPGNSVF